MPIRSNYVSPATRECGHILDSVTFGPGFAEGRALRGWSNILGVLIPDNRTYSPVNRNYAFKVKGFTGEKRKNEIKDGYCEFLVVVIPLEVTIAFHTQRLTRTKNSAQGYVSLILHLYTLLKKLKY